MSLHADPESAALFPLDGRDVIGRAHRFGLEVENGEGDEREEQTESEDDHRAAEDPAAGAAGHGGRV